MGARLQAQIEMVRSSVLDDFRLQARSSVQMPSPFSMMLTVSHSSLLSFPLISLEIHTRQPHLPGNQGAEPTGVAGSRSSCPTQICEDIRRKDKRLQHRAVSATQNMELMVRRPLCCVCSLGLNLPEMGNQLHLLSPMASERN